MPRPTTEDCKAARLVAEEPRWFGEVYDACTVVILATSHGWEVGADVLEIVRAAARVLPAKPTEAPRKSIDPSDIDDGPTPKER